MAHICDRTKRARFDIIAQMCRTDRELQKAFRRLAIAAERLYQVSAIKGRRQCQSVLSHCMAEQ